MEVLVTDLATHIATVQGDDPIVEPDWLETAIQGTRVDDPPSIEAAQQTVDQHMPYLHSRSDDHEALWFAYLRWLVPTLRSWTDQSDASGGRLTLALLVAAKYGTSVWKALADAGAITPQVVDRLDNVLASRRVELSAVDDGSIAQRSWLDRLERADANDDWETLVSEWQHLYHLEAAAIDWHALRALAASDLARVAARMDATSTYATLHTWMDALAADDALRVAILASTPRTRFASVARVMDGDRTPLPAAISTALTRVLGRIAADAQSWPKLMAAFNRYPTRVPTLQPALGATLAAAPSRAVKEYVDSIELSSASHISRDQVTACLAAFHDKAPLERRIELWQRAFDRWHAWSFGDGMLLGITHSPIDYAVTGWLVEGEPIKCSPDDFATLVEQLDGTWFESINDMRSAYLRIVSTMQPYMFAETAAQDGFAWDVNLVAQLDTPVQLYHRARYQGL